MKFNWFHLMPYRYLPDNFKEAYPSVWVNIPPVLCTIRKRVTDCITIISMSWNSPIVWGSTASASTNTTRMAMV
jgi:hypothetical protein